MILKRQAFDALLEQARIHHPTDFCPFPTDITWQDRPEFPIGASGLLCADQGLISSTYASFRDAFIAAAPFAEWRETYKGTNIGTDFMDRFGCYELIGLDGVFHSKQMRSFVVYMPVGLDYPYHHHPAEEIYMILGGEAEFAVDGGSAKVFREGDISFHASNQPHKTETINHPMMAYVLWRNHLTTPPVLTQGLEQ